MYRILCRLVHIGEFCYLEVLLGLQKCGVVSRLACNLDSRFHDTGLCICIQARRTACTAVVQVLAAMGFVFIMLLGIWFFTGGPGAVQPGTNWQNEGRRSQHDLAGVTKLSGKQGQVVQDAQTGTPCYLPAQLPTWTCGS